MRRALVVVGVVSLSLTTLSACEKHKPQPHYTVVYSPKKPHHKPTVVIECTPGDKRWVCPRHKK